MSSLSLLLQRHFGFQSFRPHQEEVCRQVTEGRDVLLVMPTGAGKSLCYQLPGLARGGTTIVISPLLALIEDQVEKLRKMGVFVDRIHSGRDRKEVRKVCFDYLSGTLQFLFIAPERLSVPGFIEMLKKRAPSLIAVDEAHCISQWGHDFRPDYRLLGDRLHEFRPAPVVALTATATPLVQNDICKQLGLNQEVRSIHGFRRTNIHVHVIELPPSSRPGVIRSILNNPKHLPAIVYAPTRKVAEQLFQELQSSWKVGIYHAGMVTSERERNQELFLSGKVDLIVATVAFGMGVDKPDIRTVIHAALPNSVEGYYQEIGRAGRDGKTSQAILLYSYSDQKTHDFFFDRDYPDVSNLKQIFQQLTSEKLPKSELKEKVGSLDSDVFEKSLEKLWIHRGAVIDFEENVSVGIPSWERTYEEQRQNKKRQATQMTDFARATQCRMLSLVRYFGDQNDTGEPCGSCDFCCPEESQKLSQSRVLTSEEQKRVAQVLAILSDEKAWAAGRIFQEIVEEDPKTQRQDVEKIFRVLALARWVEIHQDQFEKDGKTISYRKIAVTDLGKRVGKNDLAKLQISDIPSVSKTKKAEKTALSSRKGESPSSHPLLLSPLFEAIRVWRLSEAKKKGVPAYRILSDRVALAICESRPNTEASLLKVNGIGPKFSQSYGSKIIEMIQKHRD